MPCCQLTLDKPLQCDANSSISHTPPPVSNWLPLPLCLFQLTELSEMSFRLNDFFFFARWERCHGDSSAPPQPLLPLFSLNSLQH